MLLTVDDPRCELSVDDAVTQFGEQLNVLTEIASLNFDISILEHGGTLQDFEEARRRYHLELLVWRQQVLENARAWLLTWWDGETVH